MELLAGLITLPISGALGILLSNLFFRGLFRLMMPRAAKSEASVADAA